MMNYVSTPVTESPVKTIKILFADDHPMVRDAISEYLKIKGGFEVEAVSSLAEATEALKDGQFEIALIDLVMPGMDGLTSVESLVKDFPSVKIVIISGNASAALVRRSFDFGVSGFIPKNMTLSSIPSILKMINWGETFFPYSMISEVSRKDASSEKDWSDNKLTSMEIQILNLVSEGFTNKEIAWKLRCSEVSVKMHMRNICMKINARNRAHAVILGKQLGII